MPMPSYPIYCHAEGCTKLACYKIAARWSDGLQSELKTYSVCCADCLAKTYTSAVAKQRHCRQTTGETLDAPGIYNMEHGKRDQSLSRLVELETSLSAPSLGTPIS